MKETAVYIHIPFCDHKCIYCDFYSIITSDNIVPFQDALIKEIENSSALYSKERKIISIFFGGGTPSLMAPEYLRKAILALKNNFNVNSDVEITMESNPGTLEFNKTKEFREAGINRLSIGVQSFDNAELKFLTRIHDSETAISTVRDAEKAGFKNMSIDLIFNLPGQTKEGWMKNLKIASSLPLNHISAYSLILERGTILNKMVIDGKINLQDEDYDAELYRMTIDFLSSQGFYQYEVSNFAKPGYECVHNNAYWSYKDYLGLGPSAHGFINGKRYWNYSSLKMYLSKLKEEGTPVCSFEEPDKEQRLNEYIMLSLRSSGINLQDVAHKFDKNWFERNKATLNLLEQHNYIKFDNNLIKLTGNGYAVCDEILKQLN